MGNFIPPWTTCVRSFVGSPQSAIRADLWNALLYSDHVIWLPGDVLGAEWEMVSHGNDNPGSRDAIQAYEKTLRDIRGSGLTGILSAYELGYEWPYNWTTFGGKWFGPEIDVLFDKWQRDAANAHVYLQVQGLQTPASKWDVYRATHALTRALSAVMLPDVSELSIDSIAEMRIALESTLDPMRAELLRFTQGLRKAVEARDEPDALYEEARIMIQTQVEPVVREASHKAQELSKSRWRKASLGLLRTFGLAGAGFFYPELIKDALKEAIKLPEALTVNDQPKTSAEATARFVLEARRFLAERSDSLVV